MARATNWGAAAVALLALTLACQGIVACQGTDPRGAAPAEPPSATSSAAAQERAHAPAPADAPSLPPAEHPYTDEELELIFTLSPLPPPPPDPTNAVADDPDAAHLGQFLFFDRRLSRDGTMSCATCHDPGKGWADAQPIAQASAHASANRLEPLQRHTQTLWNVAYNRWFFWDGRADTLWAQALVPLEDPREHGTTRLEIAHLVHGDPQLREAYEGIFGALPDLDDEERFPAAGRPVPDDEAHPHHVAWSAMAGEDHLAVNRVFTNVAKCIAAFERRIVTNSAPFDWYVGALQRGDPALPRIFPRAAERGLKLFVGKAGCRNCHHGPNFTDLEFHNTRLPHGRGGEQRDPGRYRGQDLVVASEFNGIGPYSDDTSGEARLAIEHLKPKGHDWGEFKTPTLRNTAATAPYMHQGQLARLEDVVRFYSTLEGAVPPPHPDPLLQPLNLTEDEIRDLVAFLETLTTQALPAELLEQPASPIRPPDASPPPDDGAAGRR